MTVGHDIDGRRCFESPGKMGRNNEGPLAICERDTQSNRGAGMLPALPENIEEVIPRYKFKGKGSLLVVVVVLA